MKTLARTLLIAIAVAPTACTIEAPIGERARPGEIEDPPPIKLDVLFVIDNSGSMHEEQQKLGYNFPLFVSQLEQLPGGMPDVHIGVVSSDVGIGQSGGGCDPNGDRGIFHNGLPIPPTGGGGGGGPADAGPPEYDAGTDTPDAGPDAGPAPDAAPMPPPCGLTDRFILREITPGGTITNFTGTMSDAFSCIAQIGTSGCGLEQHLESAKEALDPTNTHNAGFLRSDAYLAIVVIADEDDCSASDTYVFDPSQTELGDPLGPFSSFRCTEYGVSCDGLPVPREAGAYTTCEPNAASAYIADPQTYVDYFTALKSDPSMVVVGVIAGDTSPFEVELNPDNQPQLSFSCGSAAQGSLAMPAVRLKWFAEQFEYNTFQSICADDFGAQITFIGSTVRAAIENGSDDRPSPSSGGGCSVSTSPSSSWLAGLLLLLVVLARRVIARTR